MFKVKDKCTLIYAAKAKRNREETCVAMLLKEKDLIGAARAKEKLEKTNKYIALIEEWELAANIAIYPAMLVADIEDLQKKDTIKTQLQQVYETGTDPRTGKKLKDGEITRQVIAYLIAKYDGKQYTPCKWIRLTPERVNAIKYALVVCKENQNAVKFFQYLLTE
jgi:hypothetical protein